MDLNIFVVFTSFDIVMVMFGLLGRKVWWAFFPYMGGAVQFFLTLGLLSDGNITELSGGVQTPVVSAALNYNTWQAVTYACWVLPAGFFIIAMLRTFKFK